MPCSLVLSRITAFVAAKAHSLSMGVSQAIVGVNRLAQRASKGLRRHGVLRSAAIALKTMRPRVYWMCRFEAVAGSIHQPDRPCPGAIEFLHASAADPRLVQISPYINEADLDLLGKTDAVCCLMRVGGEIIGFTFMVRGRLFVREIRREIVIRPGEFYGFRSYVAPAYRGRSVMAWNKYAFAKNIAKPTDRLWSLVEPRNEASIRSNVSCGFRCVADVGYVSMFGLRYTVIRKRRVEPGAGVEIEDDGHLGLAV